MRVGRAPRLPERPRATELAASSARTHHCHQCAGRVPSSRARRVVCFRIASMHLEKPRVDGGKEAHTPRARGSLVDGAHERRRATGQAAAISGRLHFGCAPCPPQSLAQRGETLAFGLASGTEGPQLEFFLRFFRRPFVAAAPEAVSSPSSASSCRRAHVTVMKPSSSATPSAMSRGRPRARLRAPPPARTRRRARPLAQLLLDRRSVCGARARSSASRLRARAARGGRRAAIAPGAG